MCPLKWYNLQLVSESVVYKCLVGVGGDPRTCFRHCTASHNYNAFTSISFQRKTALHLAHNIVDAILLLYAFPLSVFRRFCPIDYFGFIYFLNKILFLSFILTHRASMESK